MTSSRLLPGFWENFGKERDALRRQHSELLRASTTEQTPKPQIHRARLAAFLTQITPAMATQASEAQSAFKEGKYDVAITKYTEALAHSVTAAPYYIGRSTAYQRSSPPNLEAALKDAEIAVNLATKRAKRELIAEAQQRRAVSLFALGQYANAGYVFGLVKKFNDKEKTLPMWEMKVQTKLKNLPDDDPARQVTAVEVPDAEPDAAAETAAASETTKATKAPEQKTPVAPQQTPADKVRHDWYSAGENIVISLLAKGVPKDQVEVEIEERSVSIFLGVNLTRAWLTRT